MKFSLTKADIHTHTDGAGSGSTHTNATHTRHAYPHTHSQIEGQDTVVQILKFKIFVTCQMPFMRSVIARGSGHRDKDRRIHTDRDGSRGLNISQRSQKGDSDRPSEWLLLKIRNKDTHVEENSGNRKSNNYLSSTKLFLMY